MVEVLVLTVEEPAAVDSGEGVLEEATCGPLRGERGQPQSDAGFFLAAVPGECLVEVLELFPQSGGVGQYTVGDLHGMPDKSGHSVVRRNAVVDEAEDEGRRRVGQLLDVVGFQNHAVGSSPDASPVTSAAAAIQWAAAAEAAVGSMPRNRSSGPKGSCCRS
ncbi:hypothetical protein [Streptomyces sp. NBC_00258]|uniref:hypothetical protein n=1 Tax=Streptomyces sp. NBC_00258 TaxID=2903642 RepID=UPI002E284BBF|nr:hypothetical protein [Streptomyces sp. NBC_00258]